MSTSTINFEAAYSNAELRDTTDKFRAWLDQNVSMPYFTFDQLCAELSPLIAADKINRVLLRLVTAGQLDVTYRVKLNEREYSEAEFNSPDDVPDCVFDSAFEPVEVAGLDKVPSYKPALR